ncbi:MAG: M60 family metallopeptidase [Bacteroidaceae bacterium]|nr:M60 family metallopeptidase [Bacteroidaceae bacterium]
MKRLLTALAILVTAIGIQAQDSKVNVKAITTSPTSYYGSNYPALAIDGNTGTFWHSQSISGSSSTVVLTLKAVSHVDYVRYTPRQDGNTNGNWGTVEVYTAPTTTSINYSLVGSYNLNMGSGCHDFALGDEGADIGRVKFIVRSGAAGFANAAEIECFARDRSKQHAFEEYFEDNLFIQLKSGVTSSDGIEDADVKRLVDNLLADAEGYKRFRVGEFEAYRPTEELKAELRTSSLYSNYENPTGIYLKAGEVCWVAAEGIGNDAVGLKIKSWGEQGTSGSSYGLSNGLNYIMATTEGNVFVDYYTTNYESASKVRVHFVNAPRQGYWDSRTMTNTDWKWIMANKEVGDRSSSDKTIIITQSEHAETAYPAYAWKANCPTNIVETMRLYECVQWAERDIMGLKKYGRETKNRQLFYVSTTGFMAAGSDGAWCHYGSLGPIMKPDNKSFDFWGVGHEWGHNNQITPGFKWTGCGETTNNIYASWAQLNFSGNASSNLRLEDEVTGVNDYSGMRGGRMQTYFEEGLRKGVQWQLQDGPDYHGSEPGSDGGRNYDHFVKLVPFWQLNLWGTKAGKCPDIIPMVIENLRTTAYNTLYYMSNGEMQLNWIKVACDSAKINLLPFFEKAGMFKEIDRVIYDYGNARTTITTSMLNAVRSYISKKNYPAMTEEINYINGHNWEIYKNCAKLEVPAKMGTGCSLNGTKLKVQHSYVKNAVAFETYNSSDELIRITMYGLGSDDAHSFTQVLYPNEEDAAYVKAVGYDGERKIIFRGQAPVLQAGKFYSIVSNSQGGALTCGVATSTDQDDEISWSVTRAAESASKADQIWTVESYANNKYLYNPQSDCYLGGDANTAFTQLFPFEEAAYYRFDCVDESESTWTVALRGEGQYLNSYSSTNTGYWSGGSGDPNNIWVIKEVTDFNVTINSYGFLNVCLPFAVSLPTGYTANVVTEIKKVGDVTFAIMERLWGVVPARTPVILLGKKSSTCKLKLIYGNDTAAPAVNLLKGSTLKRTGYTKYSVLSTSATGDAKDFDCAEGALKASSLTYVAINKAFLQTADVGNISIAYLTLDDNPTGIADITEDDIMACEEVYDLHGRKVEKTSKGGIYIINGRKVIR